MESRREFLKKASLLAGGAGIWSMLPASIQKAMAIDPAVGSTYLDAEHIVFLMQENRSFDHTYGTLQGVRGFNDPRAMVQPNGNPVWLQTDKDGDTFAPFRLDIKNTKATWMSSLPHSWTNQVDARNHGHYDKWLHVKQSGNDEYKKIPMTMGHYTREDIPFYYSLADAFTVCDQNFCSSLTGTTPNRLFFWSGTIRGANDDAMANVWNEDADYNTMVSWTTYPERLEENGITWKVYQNDIGVDGGYTGEEDEWLSNFGDNPLEYFTQYNVKLSERYISYLEKALQTLPKEIDALEDAVHASSSKDEESGQQKKRLEEAKQRLETVKREAALYTRERYAALSAREKAIHEKAFSNNGRDPHFYQLQTLTYDDNGTQREVKVPKGDVLHQFREDVNGGKLPAVSWLVAPETFSDHPSSAWYGAWYVSEVMDILTKNPEVWKKTIFILTYDENDGYFDHVSPFMAPNPKDALTGKTSKGIDAGADFVTLSQEQQWRKGAKEEYLRESSIGLGYRVPLVIASPWSRGGWVNSEVFDHTSSLQFLEDFIEKKWGKKIPETNISTWRRAVCGNLTSAFRKYDGQKADVKYVERDAFAESIHKAKYKGVPDNYKKLTEEELALLNRHPSDKPAFLPAQEKGIRDACALPYELYADGMVSEDGKSFEMAFAAGNIVFGSRSAGAPFTVHARNYKGNTLLHQAYATDAGDNVSDVWQLADFENGKYHLVVYGPNGFYRLFRGNAGRPKVEVKVNYEGDKAIAIIKNLSHEPQTVRVMDAGYNSKTQSQVIAGERADRIVVDTGISYGWYDFIISLDGDDDFGRQYAGRIETGKPSKTDPAMGGMV